MSAPSKSIDKNKRYAGFKANDFVNKARTNEASRAVARTQGWANLGKINSRRIPPPANLPSLKSETGANVASFDSTIPTGASHGWTGSGNQTTTTTATIATNQARPITPSKQPTQQQIDSLPAHVSTLLPSSSALTSDTDKSRGPTTWSTVTAGNTANNANDQPPNLLGLNDFPRLATQDNKNSKSQVDPVVSSISTTSQGPSFRPANLASWKEGGGRAQTMSNESGKDSNENSNLPLSTQMLSSNTNTNMHQSQMQSPNNSSFMRMHQQPPQQQQQQSSQMWSYNVGNAYGSYGQNQASAQMSMHSSHHSQRVSSYGNNNQSQQRLHTSADYKAPKILKNKDIDDLSKLTDNVTWASASQEVNYEEKIRFSDDEDNEIPETNKSRRFNTNTTSQQQSKQSYPQVLQNNNRSLNSNYSQKQTSSCSRVLQDDEHVKQMQDNKNSELINTLNVAKQRRDEQERNLHDTSSQRTITSSNLQNTVDDQKQIPGYQTRPLLTSTGQDNSNSSQIESTSLWGQTTTSGTTSTSRTRHDTTDSQTFAMKSWSDQMDSFNYASLHEKSGAHGDADDHHDDATAPIASVSSTSRKYSRSQSESSSLSQPDNATTARRSKQSQINNRKQNRSNLIHSKLSSSHTSTKSKTADVIDYFNNNEPPMKSNDQWTEWDDANYVTTNNRSQNSHVHDRHSHHQNFAEDSSQRTSHSSEQTNDYNRTKNSSKGRSNAASRSGDASTNKSENKMSATKTLPVWRPLSPTRPVDTSDPTPQEAIAFKQPIKLSDNTDRRHSAPMERKQRYTSSTTPINTASIPPLMSVRSDVPPTSISTTVSSGGASKHFKSSNQSQRQDYSNSSHYSQRNDFYNEGNDAAWGNDDEYYEDETGYYDPNMQTHTRHQNMGYHSNVQHRGYIALGSYGRYRRGGALRHQQQYSSYTVNNSSNTSSQFNASTGPRAKKSTGNRTTVPPPAVSTAITSKNVNESTEQAKTATVVEPTKVTPAEPVKKPSAWSTEKKTSTVEEKVKPKSSEMTATPTEVEKPKELISTVAEPKTVTESNIVAQSEVDSTVIAKKTPPPSTTTTTAATVPTGTQKKPMKDQRYQNQQTPHHRSTYTRSVQDYESAQMATQNYYGASRRTARGGRTGRMHNASTGYYYDSSQHYSNEHYKQSSQSYSSNKTTKRAGSSSKQVADHQYGKPQSIKGASTSTNVRHPSESDNEQKEGEEWETASESSANVRTGHSEPAQQQVQKSATIETKPVNRDRTPPKKSFANQRPLSARHNEAGVHRRGHTIYERGSKTARTIVHRTSRVTSTTKVPAQTKSEAESTTAKQTSAVKKDQHRHSLDGYDLNNVAGVVKIETLPASALEEESEAADDGGDDFCLVMSKRGRKEQKAAQLSKQNVLESTANNTALVTEQVTKPTATKNDEQQSADKTSNDPNQTNATRTRSGKSVPPRFNGKPSSSTTRQHGSKNDHQNSSMYYYDQNYYYYDQNQYYDHDNSYYNYGNYGQSHRQPSTRRKQRNQQQHDGQTTDDQVYEKKNESNITEKPRSTSSNVMSNIQMWDPHTESTISNTSKLIEKPSHDRKFANNVVASSSSNDTTLPLHQRATNDLSTHSSVSKANETIARTIKPPITDHKSHRDTKGKSTTYEKSETLTPLSSNPLFEKSSFLDYDDKQSIGTVGDDYNQKINSLKTIWDTSDNQSVHLEQTISTMVAMKQKQQQQQQQDTNIQSNASVKADAYVQEAMPSSSSTKPGTNANVSSAANDDANSKNTAASGNLQSTGSSSTINQPPTYSTSTIASKNEQKNICTVKPTQQVAPNIQDQVDVTSYPPFPAPTLPPPMSQAPLQQQHLLSQSQVNPLHQQHSYQFYENILPAHPPPIPQQPTQQQQFSRMYSSTTNSTSTDTLNSDFSSVQSSQIYPPQNFQYRNANIYMPGPPNVPNTNSLYHHSSQGSISAPPQNNAMSATLSSYPPPFMMDHSGHMMSQAQPPPPPHPPQAYMNNQMLSGRPQAGSYYRAPPQQQIQTPPAPPYNTQDPLAHGGFYPPFFQPPTSNAPPVGHPSPHNLYGQNEGFHPGHPPHPQMFPRAGSIDRNDHPLMPQAHPQSLSRPTNYPSTSSNQPQQGQPPPLLSQNLKPYHTNQQPTSNSNQPPFYGRPNQYTRHPMPIGAINTTTNLQQTPQVPSLMSGISKNFSTNGNNLTTTQPLLQNRQPLLTPQSNNNRPFNQHHISYPNYSKSAGPNDDNVKPKHI